MIHIVFSENSHETNKHQIPMFSILCINGNHDQWLYSKIVVFFDDGSLNMFSPLSQCIIISPLKEHGNSQVLLVVIIPLPMLRSLWYTLVFFQSLKELYIENNHLEHLPVSLGSMPNLEILDCRHNLIKQLPDAICQAQGIESLQICSPVEFETNIPHY